MKKIREATNAEVGKIIFKLSDARTARPHSDNFLNGFPWKSVTWYKIEITPKDLVKDNLYLFWDGVAWGKAEEQPRTLMKGTKNFKNMARDMRKPHLEHITDILKKRDYYRSEYPKGKYKRKGKENKKKKRFLILVAQNENDGPFMILDGNHRAVAALWWSLDNNDAKDHLPEDAWLGIYSKMSRYSYYKRVLEAKNKR